MKTPKQIKELFEKGQNIICYLKSENGSEENTKEMIELSYDLQTGTYSRKWSKEELKPLLNSYSKEIAGIIHSLDKPNTILEAGIGEGTTMGAVLQNFSKNIDAYGFDISWSRVKFANKWLKDLKITNTKLCTGDMFNMPYCDSSIDVVYTSHSIEPNGGKEKELIKELYRVSKKYLILVEPDYDLAREEDKKRMDLHGYCKNLKKISIDLGLEVVDYIPFKNSFNPRNPSSAIVIKKAQSKNESENIYACPKYKTSLIKTKDGYFSEENLSIYPTIDGIPCLRIENSILASKYETE